MAKKKSAKARKKIAAKKNRPAKKAGVKKAAPKKRPVKKTRVVVKKKPAENVTPKKKIAAKKTAATKPAAVVPPHPAPVQTASMPVEPVPSPAGASQPKSSLIGKPIVGTGRPLTENQPLDIVQEASEESFPASDSPSITQMKPR